MPDIADGDSVEFKGSAAKPYILKNSGGVFSCTCPAWRNQSIGIERRTCKHLRKYRGEQAETDRLGTALPARPESSEGDDDAAGTGPGLLLAQSWTNDVDLSGWWLSEKLDGVRAYWDGKQFLSRQGNLFHAPDWFTAELPEMPLDGELWIARKSFQRTVSVVRRQDKSDHWNEVTYVVFDAPHVDDVFERRLEAARDTLLARPAQFARMLPQERCRDLEHLSEQLAHIESLGGEGLMLRQPESRYEAGRSSTLLKVKRFHDAEARVVDHLPGAGRHKGRLGALAVVLPDGTEFSVGTGFSDAQRENPPAVGSQITFRYQELSDRGVPRFPSFVRVRSDAASTISTEATTPAAAKRDKPAKPTPVQPPGTTAVRNFEFVEGNSSKFWAITQTDNEVTVRYGRLGTAGQKQTKTFPTPEAAGDHAEKLISQKLEKGYVEP